MKLLLRCWLVLLPYASKAQSAPTPADSSTTASPNPFRAATIATPGVARTELYLRAKLWLLNNHSLGRYKWLGDKNTNLIALTGEYYLPTVGYNGVWFYYSLKLLLHDGNYHYTVRELYFRKRNETAVDSISTTQLLAAPATRKVDRRYQALAREQLTLLLSSLNGGMQRPSTL
jgi:hypothetical protein